MRAFRQMMIATAFLLLAVGAAAEPLVAPDYRLETVRVPGAAFAGLSRDGDALLVTDLVNGRLYRRMPSGELVAFGPTFPHGLDVTGDPTGPYRVLRAGDDLIVAQGWTPANFDEGPYDHALVAINGAGERRVISADFWNPFDLVMTDDAYYVVDSARNSVERLGADGRKQTLMSFRRMRQQATAMETLSPTEFKGEDSYEVDAVPTGIALRDGRLVVTLFGGFPFLAGAGKVVSISEKGEDAAPRPDVEGLNAPVAVAFDPEGRLLILEHGLYDQQQGFRPESGRLLRFDEATGRREIVLDGLTRPVSVLVWDRRQIVVSELGGTLLFLSRDEGR
ncbi:MULTISPECIES: ScyD/ScyE family protein [unclassified Ensifer]|uniref:ScyD/ScyE family protein n=1 Tax=unclassified Ensifer TaxID=2633371 RepID=UPI000813562C|nr:MULTISPECIES: ScyD/ScyE family protein [unclassified Ensifer]OCO99965.1 hypothetical protein BC374_08550 [Ensifer sp. LC13]OCP00098.1 hypothetical protein BBX50_08465 [Ensifer sp. LC11]OCP04051.1 hypothetical protein BC362_16970 [Ensifer sp. LC14]OCP30986.1 hypothetical protein BC364_03960 [Ensifer sp. LC499]